MVACCVVKYEQNLARRGVLLQVLFILDDATSHHVALSIDVVILERDSVLAILCVTP